MYRSSYPSLSSDISVGEASRDVVLVLNFPSAKILQIERRGDIFKLFFPLPFLWFSSLSTCSITLALTSQHRLADKSYITLRKYSQSLVWYLAYDLHDGTPHISAVLVVAAKRIPNLASKRVCLSNQKSKNRADDEGSVLNMHVQIYREMGEAPWKAARPR
jgi:hypothetical protein